MVANDKYLFVLTYNGNTDGSPAYLSSYEISSTGTLSHLSDVNVGSFAVQVCFTGDGEHLAVLTSQSDPSFAGRLSIYEIDKGKVS